jgi:hypothetical protein
MNTVNVPPLWVWLGHLIAIITVVMALLAVVRLRPARRRKNHDSRPDPDAHHGDGH